MAGIGERHSFLVLAATGAFAILSSTLSKTPALPLFAAHLGATSAEIGLVAMASTVSGILISLPAGMLCDFVGKHRLLMAALVVFATAPFLYLPISHVWQLVVVRFYHGFATAIFGTVASVWIAGHYVTDRAKMLSTYSSITTVGRSVAPFLGGTLISLAGFHAVYLACAAAGVMALALGMLLPRDSGESAPPAARTWPVLRDALVTTLGNGALLATSATEAAQYFVFGAVETFLAVYAETRGITAWKIGVILGLQLVCVALVKPMIGHVSDRVGRRPAILAGLAVAMIGVALLPLFSTPLPLAALSIVFGTGFASVTSSTGALVGDLSSQGQLGTSMGMLRTIMDTGQAAGPVITGAVISAFGYTTGFEMLAALLLATAVWVRLRVPATVTRP
ncbi:MAG: MFS transporter [Acidiferrobacterales bacterium]